MGFTMCSMRSLNRLGGSHGAKLPCNLSESMICFHQDVLCQDGLKDEQVQTALEQGSSLIEAWRETQSPVWITRGLL